MRLYLLAWTFDGILLILIEWIQTELWFLIRNTGLIITCDLLNTNTFRIILAIEWLPMIELHIVCLVEHLFVIELENTVILVLLDNIEVTWISFEEVNVLSMISLILELEPITNFTLMLFLMNNLTITSELLLITTLVINSLPFARIKTLEQQSIKILALIIDLLITIFDKHTIPI